MLQNYNYYIVRKSNASGLSTADVISVFTESNDLDAIRKTVENASERLYVSWASVDVTDKDNELIPIEDIINQQDILLRRNGPIIDNHTNKPIGQTLAYKVMTHPDTKTLGVLHLNKIFNDTDYDTRVWNEIVNGDRTGSSVGGINSYEELGIDIDTGLPRKIIRGFNHLETSSVYSPANPFALNEAVSIVAKSEKDVNKPFAGYDNFDSCVSQNSDKSNPEAYCSTIMRAVEKIDNEHCLKKVSVINNVLSETNKSDNIKNCEGEKMSEEVKKSEYASKEDMEDLKKQLSALSKAMESLVSDDSEKKKQDSMEEEEEETDKKKEEPKMTTAAPEAPVNDSPNQEDVFKSEVAKTLSEITKSIKELKESQVVRKSETPRPEVKDEEETKSVEKSKSYNALDIALGKQKTNFFELNSEFEKRGF